MHKNTPNMLIERYKKIISFINKPSKGIKKEEKMAKLTAWLVTLAGIILLLIPLGVISLDNMWFQWALAIVVLVIGISKLVRNYSKRKR